MPPGFPWLLGREADSETVLVVICGVRFQREVRRCAGRVARQAVVILDAHIDLRIYEVVADVDRLGAVDGDEHVIVDVVVGPRRHSDDVFIRHSGIPLG